LRFSSSVIKGDGASRSSRNSSAAPWIEVSGDFSSWETWVAKVSDTAKLRRPLS
jgi:hypothetical protein